MKRLSHKLDNLTIIIPAYNEESTIERVLRELWRFKNIIVIDDYSLDNTKEIAKIFCNKVITNVYRKGYIGAIKTGIQNVETKYLGTMDADGEHNLDDLLKLYGYLLDNRYDLVIGRRPLSQIYRPSEVLISAVTKIRSPVFDTGSCMRIYKTELAKKMNFYGACICGTSILEALRYTKKIAEYPIKLEITNKYHGIAWYHFR